jgi:enterochelin esterase-like enzyme
MITAALLMLLGTACRSKIKEQDDEIYSRHLQRHVALRIITTPMPSDKSDMHLLLINGIADMKKMDLKKLVDSLYKKKAIEPLVIVAVGGAEDEMGLSGISDPGKSATKPEKYNEFFSSELYPFIKKKVATRKFKSIAILGFDKTGISAFDIAWNNADKIQKVGIFSGDYNYHGKDDTARNIFSYVASSRKRPKMLVWLYAGDQPDSSQLINTLRFADALESKKSIAKDDIVVNEDKISGNDREDWRKNFAAFLTWAFAK